MEGKFEDDFRKEAGIFTEDKFRMRCRIIWRRTFRKLGKPECGGRMV